MSQKRSDKPRTGDGYKAKGVKPDKTGIMQVRHARGPVHSVPARDQPKGWGIAKVIDLFTRKNR